jgi:hypothetical protein
MAMAVTSTTSAVPLQPLARTTKRPSVNNEVSGGARIALDVLLPITTGIVADQILKSSLKSGKAQAIVLSLVGSAAVHAVTEGAVQVVKNRMDGLPWDNRLGIRALRGAQGGAFIALGNLVGPAIQGGVAKRFSRMNPILLVGVSNATAAVACGVVRLSADPDTWRNGAVAGLKRIAITNGINAGTAMLAGSGIKGLAIIPSVGRVFQKLPYPFSG